MMNQLLENTNKKKSLRYSKRKQTTTPFESSEEKKKYALHIEISSKQIVVKVALNALINLRNASSHAILGKVARTRSGLALSNRT